MVSQPLVTVICTCYNHALYVIETLESVTTQTYKNIELIIIDDFSSDESVKVIEPWLIKNPAVRFIKNTANLGITKTFNKAASYASGSFLVDLSCDDLLQPNTIAQQIAFFLTKDLDKTALIFGNAIHINEKGDYISEYFPNDSLVKPASGDIYKNILQGGLCMCSVSAMINKKLFDNLNGYDPSLVYEDLDFWIRASRDHFIYYQDTIWVKKRVLPKSLSAHFSGHSGFSKAITKSTYSILKKAYRLNQNKKEDKALLHRVHYQINLAFKNLNLYYFSKFLFLKIALEFKRY